MFHLETIKPRFFVVSESYLPVCANPEEDAGADLKAYLEKEPYVEDMGSLREYWFPPTQGVYVDGKQVKDYSELVEKHEGKRAVVIEPGQTRVISAGFKIALPDLTKFGPYKAVYKIVSRSGLSIKHGIKVANAPGIIDAGYRDYVKVGLENTRNSVHIFTEGSRIAQGLYEIVFDQAAYSAEEVCVSSEEFDSLTSQRGTGGLGSTNV
jgi:dUTP pyrophosphatase